MKFGTLVLSSLLGLAVSLGCGGSDDDSDTGSSSGGESSSSSSGGESSSSSSGGESSSSSSSGGELSARATVQIIVNRACTRCHSGRRPSADRSLADIGESINDDSNEVPGAKVIVPGDADASLLVQLLKGPVGGVPRMPEGGRLPEDDIATIEAWVNDGAP